MKYYQNNHYFLTQKHLRNHNNDYSMKYQQESSNNFI